MDTKETMSGFAFQYFGRDENIITSQQRPEQMVLQDFEERYHDIQNYIIEQ